MNTFERGYKDIGLFDTSSIASYILWYLPINPSLLTITLYHSVTTLFYNDPKYKLMAL